MTEACADHMWAGAGCTTERDFSAWRDWAKNSNLSLLDLKQDFYVWSRSLAPHHVEACQSPYQRPDLAQEKARAENGDAPSGQSAEHAAGNTVESSENIARFSAASGLADIAVVGGVANWKITLPDYKFIRSAVFSNASAIRNFDLIMLDERGAEVRRISGLNTAGEAQFTLDVNSSQAQQGLTGTPLDAVVICFAKEIQIEASGSVEALNIAFDLPIGRPSLMSLKQGYNRQMLRIKQAQICLEQSQKAQAASESQAAKKPSIAQQFVPPTIASRVGTHGARTNSAGEKVADFHMPPASTQFPSDVDPSANWEQYATLYPVGTKIDLTVRDGQKDAYIFPGEVSQEFEFREWLDGTFFGIQSDLQDLHDGTCGPSESLRCWSRPGSCLLESLSYRHHPQFRHSRVSKEHMRRR